MPAHRIRPARSPDRPPLHPTTCPARDHTRPNRRGATHRSPPHALRTSRSEAGKTRTGKPMRPDAPQILRQSPDPPIFLPPKTAMQQTWTTKSARSPSSKLSADPKETAQNGQDRCVRSTASPLSASRPTASPPKTAMQQTRTTKTHTPRPNCPPIRGKRPKTERTGTCACTADASARSSAAAFFLPRRRERDSMRTEERERQAKKKKAEKTQETGRREGNGKAGDGENEENRQPRKRIRPCRNGLRQGRILSRIAGQDSLNPSRFRALSIGNNRLCKVLRH